MLHFPSPLIKPTGFTARHTEKITNRNPDSPAGSQPTGDHSRTVPELTSYLRFCLSAKQLGVVSSPQACRRLLHRRQSKNSLAKRPALPTVTKPPLSPALTATVAGARVEPGQPGIEIFRPNAENDLDPVSSRFLNGSRANGL